MKTDRRITGVEAEYAWGRVLADRIMCHGDREDNGPQHDRCMLRDGVFYNGGCESNGRYYDRLARKMEGRAHCSCGECFD